MNRIKLFLSSVQVMLFKDRLEVWNPGKLPQGMTIAKLTKEHNSNPVNPVLANPVYLAAISSKWELEPPILLTTV